MEREQRSESPIAASVQRLREELDRWMDTAVTQGGKALKMVFSDDPTPGKTVETVEVADDDSIRYSLADEEIIELSRIAVAIEKHYGRPMDIEWGKDGTDGKLYILQARPETVQSRAGRSIHRFTLKSRSNVLTSGRSIGQKIGAGTVIPGPAIVQEMDSTTLILPGHTATVDDIGNLLINPNQ